MSTLENNPETTRTGGITGNGFKPGQSGNPEDAPKDSREHSETPWARRRRLPVAFWRLLIQRSGPRDRIAAWRELLDRGWGKAPAFAAMETDDPLELSEIAREIQTIGTNLQRGEKPSPSTEATASWPERNDPLGFGPATTDRFRPAALDAT